MSKIDKLRLIPKNTKVYSIALQENIFFEKDMIVKITNEVLDNDNYVFGKLQLELFKNMLPTCIDKANGDVSFNYDDTKHYSLDLPF